MSATNLTKNLKLSQFVASDKPSWLGDVNGDNKKIDDGYGVLVGEISKANDTASSAKSQSDANTQTLTNVNSELEDYGNRITALEAGGGTEQLEQRVQTIESDVEALQTRADAFEENISQNSTNITSLTSRVTTLEPKVKSNADNITTLTSKTTDLSSSIENLTSTVANIENKLPSQRYIYYDDLMYGTTLFTQNPIFYTHSSPTAVEFKNIILTPRTSNATVIPSTKTLLGKISITSVFPNNEIAGRTLLTTSSQLSIYGTTINFSFEVNGTDLEIYWNTSTGTQVNIPSFISIVIPIWSLFWN